MDEKELLPHLFRTEYRKLVSVLCYLFGIEHIEIAEDIVSDTFLSASESWSIKGTPDNPTAWLYTVAKNKTKNHLKRHNLFEQKLSPDLKYTAEKFEELEIDLSAKNINDSQLAMIFTVCNPCISNEAQISLALNLLCGFSAQEIADAFLTNKELVYKRIQRAKEKLKEDKVQIEQPKLAAINARLDTVLTTLYLLFSEGYYSTSHHTVLRRDLCAEAMRLTYLLVENQYTNKPSVNALLSLMCFHSSRFDARLQNGVMILYDDQDERLWNVELIEKGIYYLNQASQGRQLTKFHLEAGIAYWHTHKEDTKEKWENILQLYNHLLILEYSPIAALNRTYALAKSNGKEEAIKEAEKLNLIDNPFYYSLLGNLYTGLDNRKASAFYRTALTHTRSDAEQVILKKFIEQLLH
ncbi:sigma-70 family RNA polymerase sigma factor [Olivibacter sp. CPCC 100613]|uniref:RNA polymerase sigma factor n=1 Tax=Olivibacter sp. CPCC 100613 TaxID=3079931 RepID=UPI002FF73C07